jgi:DNA-binding MarR family transcriptional regulator
MPVHRDRVDEMLEEWGAQRPDLDPSGLGIVLRVLILAGVLDERLKEALAPVALAPWEFDVLSALRRSGTAGTRSPTELCASAQLTSGAMTHRLDRLEERGLVARRRGGADRRSIGVALTRRGRALIDRAATLRMSDALDCVAALSRSQRRTLESLLRVLGHGLDDTAGAGPGAPMKRARAARRR